jgi:hypothetical protein
MKRKKHTRFVECLVAEFLGGEGWELQSLDNDEVYEVTFEDFVHGRVYLSSTRKHDE